MEIESIVAVNNRAGKGIVHAHHTWEWILTCSGKGSIVVENKEFLFEHGTIVCIPPNRVHYNVSFEDYAHIAVRVSHFLNPTQETVPVFYDDEEKTFETICKIALRYFYQKENGKGHMLYALYHALCGFFESKADQHKSNHDVEKVKNTMIDHFSDPGFHLADALCGIHYSIGHFRRLFCMEMGMTPLEYLTRLRLEYAKRLLEENHALMIPIAHVALQSGFYDARYFSRVFKAYVGLTPQAYRESVRQEKAGI